MFEAFLFSGVDDAHGKATVGSGVVLFQLDKKQAVLWNQLQATEAQDKEFMKRKREEAVQRAHTKAQEEKERRAKEKREDDRHAVREQMRVCAMLILKCFSLLEKYHCLRSGLDSPPPPPPSSLIFKNVNIKAQAIWQVSSFDPANHFTLLQHLSFHLELLLWQQSSYIKYTILAAILDFSKNVTCNQNCSK